MESEKSVGFQADIDQFNFDFSSGIQRNAHFESVYEAVFKGEIGKLNISTADGEQQRKGTWPEELARQALSHRDAARAKELAITRCARDRSAIHCARLSHRDAARAKELAYPRSRTAAATGPLPEMGARSA